MRIFFFQAEDGIRDADVTGVQTCALPISASPQYAERIKKAGQVPAPALLEFDQQGNIVQAWGVPGQGGWTQGKDRPFPAQAMRSEERRVGKECRSRWSPYH